MRDKITELVETLQRLERLLVRFEIDTAARLHPVDYHAVIQQLCDSFDEQMSALAGSGGEDSSSARATSTGRSVGWGTSRVRGSSE